MATDHHPATLRGELVELVRVGPDDVPALLELWASSPDVLSRWPVWKHDDLAWITDAAEADRSGWWITAAGDPQRLGFIQHYEETDPEYRHGGIDIFLVEAGQGRGLGTDAVRTLARYLVHEVGHHRLIIDPAVDNERAIRCYEKVGFRRVGVMREYERGPVGEDGTAVFHDGLLMDLLARELT
ncbi:MAG: aminoglycoside 6-adenylyltransferase [Thermoleophilia bacterium]|nr:aminoglycoside 6-adenylyltransferase [Thermoleophilia bacterium]